MMQFNPKYVSKYNKKQKVTNMYQNEEINFKAQEVQFSKPIQIEKNYESKVERIQLRKWNG